MDCLDGGEEDQLECPSEPPPQRVEKQQVVANLMSRVESPPAKYKYQEEIWMKFQEQQSYYQISEISGYCVAQVGAAIHTAIMDLRRAEGCVAKRRPSWSLIRQTLN